jgi:TRAP-type C4-dicarboxylate transport system substrate-binding protein
MSKRTWDKLSAADHKVFMAAAAEATQMQRKLSKEADEKLVAEIKGKGVQIDTVDTAPFVQATRAVYDKWSAGPVGEFVKRVVQASR